MSEIFAVLGIVFLLIGLFLFVRQTRTIVDPLDIEAKYEFLVGVGNMLRDDAIASLPEDNNSWSKEQVALYLSSVLWETTVSSLKKGSVDLDKELNKSLSKSMNTLVAKRSREDFEKKRGNSDGQ